jgi:hypothetical protein
VNRRETADATDRAVVHLSPNSSLWRDDIAAREGEGAVVAKRDELLKNPRVEAPFGALVSTARFPQCLVQNGGHLVPAPGRGVSAHQRARGVKARARFFDSVKDLKGRANCFVRVVVLVRATWRSDLDGDLGGHRPGRSDYLAF